MRSVRLIVLIAFAPASGCLWWVNDAQDYGDAARAGDGGDFALRGDLPSGADAPIPGDFASGDFASGDTSIGGDRPPGDSAPPLDNARAQGLWVGTQVGWSASSAWTAHYDVTFDGLGTASSTVLSASRGTTGTFVYSYAAYADGSTVSEGLAPGAVDAANSLGIAGDVDEGDGDISVFVVGKTGVGKSAASLTGDWYMMTSFAAPGVLQLTVLHTAFFDGAGGADATVLSASDGSTGNASAGYTVQPDGRVSSVGAGLNAEGFLTPDDQVQGFVETNPGAGALAWGVGIKQGSGMSDAVAIGPYVMVSYWSDDLFNTEHITSGEVIFDGSGGLQWVTSYASDGVLGSGVGSYQVATNGGLSFDLDGAAQVGGLKQDGSIFAVVDTDESDSVLAIRLGIQLQ